MYGPGGPATLGKTLDAGAILKGAARLFLDVPPPAELLAQLPLGKGQGGAIEVVHENAASAAYVLSGDLRGEGLVYQWRRTDRASEGLPGAKSLANSVRITKGDYIVIPKMHGSALKQTSGLKMLDGFLVPKEAQMKDMYDAYPTVNPDMTYLSLRMQVSPARLANCLLPMPGAAKAAP